MRFFIFLIISCVNINAINSAFFTPSITQTNFLSFGIKFNINPSYYYYKPSPLKISIPNIEGNLKLGKNAVFNIKYDYYMLDKSEIKDETTAKIISKSNGALNDKLIIGGGDIVTSIQFNLGDIKLGNTDLLIETKWPNAEHESGLGTDMTDINFRFINGYFFLKYHFSINYGMKVLGDPNNDNTQGDYYTFGTTYQYSTFMVSINEDISRYSPSHSLTDVRFQYVYKHLLLKSGFSYEDRITNKTVEISFILD